MSILQKYTEVTLLIQQLTRDNHVIFDQYNDLMKQQADLEEQLKAEVRESGDQENGTVKAVRMRAWKKWLDIDILKTHKKDFETLKKNGAVIIKEEVSMGVVEKLAQDGLIDRKIIVEAYKEEEQTARIKITVL